MRYLPLFLICASPAWAFSSLTSSPSDEHVRTVIYDPMNRIPVTLQKGMVTNITFDSGERIKRVAMGTGLPVTTLDAADTNQSPVMNNVPFFGSEVGSTNAVVVTLLSDGSERSYIFSFRVVAAPKDGTEAPEATFSLIFTYPIQKQQAQKVEQAQTWRQKKETAERKLAEDRLNTDVWYGPQNWKYFWQGTDSDLAAMEVHDNGRATGFRYPGNMTQPTIYIVTDAKPGLSDVCTTGKASGDQGQERAVRIDNYDDLMIVHETAPHFRLRLGDKVLDSYNCGWDPVGSNPGTGTGSPEVYRRVVTQK